MPLLVNFSIRKKRTLPIINGIIEAIITGITVSGSFGFGRILSEIVPVPWKIKNRIALIIAAVIPA
ncbi:hypothetical protein AAFH68_16960 [Flavobacterium sp. CGRL1]